MNHKAMSLVEVIVALVVLSIAALGVASTINLVSQGRTSTGSLDLQAASHAREVFEMLKNAVSTETATTAAMLVDADGLGSNATVYGPVAAAGVTANANLVLPGGDFKDKYSGLRTYKVLDIDADGDNVADYKKVTVTVTWNG